MVGDDMVQLACDALHFFSRDDALRLGGPQALELGIALGQGRGGSSACRCMSQPSTTTLTVASSMKSTLGQSKARERSARAGGAEVVVPEEHEVGGHAPDRRRDWVDPPELVHVPDDQHRQQVELALQRSP